LRTQYADHCYANDLTQYLKRFVTSEKKLKNNVSKECILTLFETIWNYRETFVMAHNPPWEKDKY